MYVIQKKYVNLQCRLVRSPDGIDCRKSVYRPVEKAGGRQDILKKTLSVTFYLRLSNLVNSYLPHGKAVATSMSMIILGFSNCISLQRGLRYCLSSEDGHTRASIAG